MSRADTVLDILKTAVETLETAPGSDFEKVVEAAKVLQLLEESDFEEEDWLILRELKDGINNIELGRDALVDAKDMKMEIQTLYSRWVFESRRSMLE